MSSVDTQPHMRKAKARQQENLPELVNSARMTVSDAPGVSHARGVSIAKLPAGILQRRDPTSRRPTASKM
jgi:hypothetical protein